MVAVIAFGIVAILPFMAAADNPPCTIVGTEGDDELIGTSGDDVICGLGGNDTISAGGGNDVVYGGAGADVISGGSGDDDLHGDEGDDQLSGGSGEDEIWGDEGNDGISGGSGNDTLRGGAGLDTASGGSGIDACEAETQTSCEAEAPTLVEIGWSSTDLSLVVSTGSSDATQLKFTVDEDVEEGRLEVTGAVADLTALLQPTELYPLDAGVEYEAVVAVTVPTSTDLGSYTGQIQLVADGMALTPAVDLIIEVVEPTADVDGFGEPSGDRITPSDVGPDYVDGELLVALASSVPDPDTLIQEIAADNGGVPVGGEARLRLYQVRVPASGLEALRSMRDVFAQHPDVEFAALHYVGDSLSGVPDDPEWDSWDESDPRYNRMLWMTGSRKEGGVPFQT